MSRQWVIDVREALDAGRLDGDVGGSVRLMPPISRVPAKVREMNEKAYQPEVVSIGPYHHGEERLQAMEKQKQRALLHYFNRSNYTPEACLELLRYNLSQMMSYYDNLDKKWEDDDHELFLKVMLMDGCFIVEILFTSQGMVEDYDEDDPIFGRLGRLCNAASIKRDLLMIENQIPFLVLRLLLEAFHSDGMSLSSLTAFVSPESGMRMFDLLREQSLHMLDYCRWSSIVRDERGEVLARSDYNITKKLSARAPKIPSAMALQDHGILMRPHCGRVISFYRRGLLWKLDVPVLTVDEATESAFLNAMVFESVRYPQTHPIVTSYVSLMSQLIVSPMDANLLSTELGIIRNGLIGSDQALVDLFKRLSSSADVLPHYNLICLQERINKYCGRRWNRFRAYVNRTYFRNPWAQISVFSAIILFVLTAVQTFYAIYPNYTNNNQNPK